MTEVKFDRVSWQQDRDGVWLCLRAEAPSQVAEICRQYAEPKKYVAELKEWRQKRSLDANRYMWQLLDKLGEVLGTTKEELYIGYVRRIGPFKDFHLAEDEAKTFRRAWEMLGTGWPTEQVGFTADGEQIVIRAYYGSSTYNSRRMARLIDEVVGDCKEAGVETLTPMELDRMKEEWGK